jgi:thiol:disulfide interchange protein
MKKLIGLIGLFVFQLGISYGGTLQMSNGFSVSKYFSAESSEEGIQFFEGTWSEALEKSTKEKKVIFLDAYASWCGPCKIMARKTFTDPKVGAFFNKHFINVKMDMEKTADGKRLSRKFSLRAYPTLYFVNGNEEIVHETLGYHKPNEFIEVGKTVIKK